MIAANQDPNLGLDEFGDITIGLTDLAVIRGGWQDRDGVYYEDTPTEGKSSSLNIYFNGTVSDSISNRRMYNNKNLIKNS